MIKRVNTKSVEYALHIRPLLPGLWLNMSYPNIRIYSAGEKSHPTS